MASLPPSGGEANVTKTYFESLPPLGYDLYLIDVGKRNSKFHPGKFSLYNIGRMIRHLWKLILASIIFRPRYTNLMFSARGAIAKFALFAFISKLLGIRVIGQMHSGLIINDYQQYSEFKRKLIHVVFRLPFCWVVLGNVWKEFMVQASVDPTKIAIIPNAVKETFADIAKSRRAPIESTAPLILFVGSVGHRKGLDLLLDALVEIEAEGIEFMAQIVGGEEIPGERQRYIDEYHERLRDTHFEFIPHTEGQELVDLFTHASIFVLPSRAENLPVSMLEAMACALPVIVSGVGAVDEVVQNGKNGIAISPGRSDELRNSLILLLSNSNLRRQLGENAQETILRSHLPQRVGELMHEFLVNFEEC